MTYCSVVAVLASVVLTKKHFGHYTILQILSLRSPSNQWSNETEPHMTFGNRLFFVLIWRGGVYTIGLRSVKVTWNWCSCRECNIKIIIYEGWRCSRVNIILVLENVFRVLTVAKTFCMFLKVPHYDLHTDFIINFAIGDVFMQSAKLMWSPNKCNATIAGTMHTVTDGRQR